MKVIQGGKDFSQLSLIRDTEEVIKFLEFAGKKLIFDEHAVQCRVTACNNLFSVVNEEEDSLEYILQNLDLFTHRFRNKNKNVSDDTLKVYKSRVKSSLEDYRSWSTDPFGWERSLSEKKLASAREKNRSKKAAEKAAEKTTTVPVTPPTRRAARKMPNVVVEEKVETLVSALVSVSSQEGRRISFPISPECTVDVVLPVDGLTLKELKRLGMFLYPYCKDADENSSVWATPPQSN